LNLVESRVLSLLISLAYAQTEACTPQPATALTNALASVEPMLGEDPGKAAKTLTQATEIARCLSAPIDRPTLARLAWAHAELASLKQDTEATWSWASLAADAGQPKPPDRVPKHHPMRSILEDAPEPSPVTGPDDVELEVPKKGSIYADGQKLTAPALRLDSQHLVQVFDKDGLYLGFWQSGAAFPKSLLVATDAVRVKPTGDAHDAVPPTNWKPAKSGTVEAYETWIKKHPEGPWVQEAKNAIDEIHWEIAKKDGSELAYRQYAHDFEDGLHVRKAMFEVEHDAYMKVMERPTRERWTEFHERFPEGMYATEARTQVESIDWRAAQKANTSSSYAAFAKQYAKGTNHDTAIRREEERTFEKAASVLSPVGLRAYLERWPQGRFVREANALLGGVEIVQTTVEVTGDLEPEALKVIETQLLELLESRKLPVVTAIDDQTGRLSVVASSHPDGNYTRVLAEARLDFGDLSRPLIGIDINSQVVNTADLGATLGTMLKESLPPFDIWHHPPEEEGADATAPKKPLVVK
jgi:hypothetical protein